MFQIFKSLTIVAVVGVGLSFSLKQFLGFWETFTLVCIVQFILAFWWKSFNINKTNRVIDELARDLEEVLNKQQANVECPCGKSVIPVVIFPDEDILVQCDKCNNTFRVTTEIKTQLVTEPVNMENIFDKLKGTTV